MKSESIEGRNANKKNSDGLTNESIASVHQSHDSAVIPNQLGLAGDESAGG
jgi:hypothetical protein